MNKYKWYIEGGKDESIWMVDDYTYLLRYYKEYLYVCKR